MTTRKRGRPGRYPMPEPISDTPENIMKAILRTHPTARDGWRFMQKRTRRG